ncbi:hypothetical protein [Rubellimicrobium sp. CFH 75288]|uniref:hypothetical protein n=1 Tax=Rubellimicrobium sp. CFH 75288 TaxID=2697034 RepID=UPI0014122D96|nr:hypothetical protein [Rubellimicrobium sp. CFH 75288]NAZ35589.1 hypothetical protein [Rubellimicrobium sp. CFH 75288]
MPSETPLDLLDLDLSDLSEEDWLARLDSLGDEHGYFERLGPHHAALFIDAGRTLLVTFETVEGARRAPGAAPRGLEHVTRNGWSLLAVFSHGETWFRDPAVWGTFDRLTDDGFFEDFDRVLFTGAGPAGYAAAAFSVAAPGARVLALRPYATLDPSVAGWDRRHLRDRRRDFTSRYGYAPEMIDAADRVFVLHDPNYAPDAMHAALFHKAHVLTFRCPLAGVRIEAMLDQMGVTPQLVDLAMEGRLDRLAFARLWRARRAHLPYLRGLLKRLEADGRRRLAARVCRHGLATRDRPLFERKLLEWGEPVPAPPTEAAE